MLTLLEAQQENDRLPAKLPSGTVVAHKTGELDGVRNDAGIIHSSRLDYPRHSDQRPACRKPSSGGYRHIGRLAYDAEIARLLPAMR
jgi:Beta-lactamase enzyme family